MLSFSCLFSLEIPLLQLLFLVPNLTLISNGLTNLSATKDRKGEQPQKKGENPLLLIYSRLAIKSFAFLKTYYLRNINHTFAGFFLSKFNSYMEKADTHFIDHILIADRKGEEPLLL